MEYFSMDNRECKIRTEIRNVNSYGLLFILFKCIGSCNNINDPFVKLYLHDVVKIMNIKNYLILFNKKDI